MTIEDGRLTIGGRTIDLSTPGYILAAALIIVFAISIYEVLGHFQKSKEDVSGILAVLAILYAVIQFVDSRLQKRETNSIARSMSTRFIGLFPKNLHQITEVIAKGTRYIYIVADFADYGAYSFPAAFDNYLQKIREARNKGVKVKIICYNKKRADEDLEARFPDKDFSKEIKSTMFRRYFEAHRGLGECKTAPRLREILMKRQSVYITQLREEGVNFRYFPGQAEFFLWLEDDEEAVFAFKDVGKQQREFSFRTQDANLIRQFKHVFDQRWEASDSDYDKPGSRTTAAGKT